MIHLPWKHKPQPSPVVPETVYAVPVFQTDPTFGPEHAKVTIVEVFEFLCPYSFAASSIIQRALAEFPTDVRVVTKYRIIHGQPALLPGISLFAAAKQGKAREMHDGLWHLLWDDPDNRNEEPVMEILDMATAMGLDMAEFKSDIQSYEGINWITRSQDIMDMFNVHSVPNFFINGRLTPRVRYEEFRLLIEEERSKKFRPYEEIIADGLPKAHRS